MLKLSGWSRLTWGRVGGPRGGRRDGVVRGHGDTARRVSRHPQPPCDAVPGTVGSEISAIRAPGGAREASFRTPSSAPPPPPPHGGAGGAGDLGGRRCVTPRQTCPRPEGVGRNLRSKTRWFTGFCNSHQVSHLATFFIDARAEISVAESRSIRTQICGARRGARGRSGFLGASRAGVCGRPAGRGGAGRRPAPPARLSGDVLVRGSSFGRVSTMILPQVHLRKPCYDFSFL